MPHKNPHAVALGRRGGMVSSDAKTRAARRNARHGGRKPKFQVGDLVAANEHAPIDYRGHTGRVTQIGPGKSEYGVAFDHKPAHMMSWWLDPAS